MTIINKYGGGNLTPNKEYILKLVCNNDWSWAELARKMGVSKAEVSRWLNGRRNGGRKFISGIIKAFPDEPLEKLFFLPYMTLKGDSKRDDRN